jgi:hypothetical protein
MLRSQAALWESTGSLEMSVFHTLLAGNTGQFGAPGTVVPVTAAVPADAGLVALATAVAGRLAGPADVALLPAVW